MTEPAPAVEPTPPPAPAPAAPPATAPAPAAPAPTPSPSEPGPVPYVRFQEAIAKANAFEAELTTLRTQVAEMDGLRTQVTTLTEQAATAKAQADEMVGLARLGFVDDEPIGLARHYLAAAAPEVKAAGLVAYVAGIKADPTTAPRGLQPFVIGAPPAAPIVAPPPAPPPASTAVVPSSPAGASYTPEQIDAQTRKAASSGDPRDRALLRQMLDAAKAATT